MVLCVLIRSTPFFHALPFLCARDGWRLESYVGQVNERICQQVAAKADTKDC